ncbi:MAG: hypothetical protein HDT32_07500 [Clostridiales bacterium]|nr:hypothetical protein [Clostridiales bacterium]
MIARIISNDGREYYSHIFARFVDGFSSTVIVFDDDAQKFVHICMYDTDPHIIRKVFIIDNDKTGFIEKGEDIQGYGWLLDNAALLKAIKKNKKVDDEYINIAVELNNSIKQQEWTDICAESDAENLLVAAWYFHDSYIEIAKIEDDRITVTFCGCWNSKVELTFEGHIQYRYEPYNEYSANIDFASILFSDGYVYWVDEDVTDVSDITDDMMFFRGKTLKWKQTIGNDED